MSGKAKPQKHTAKEIAHKDHEAKMVSKSYLIFIKIIK